MNRSSAVRWITTTLYKSVGVAVHDAAAAALVLARERGVRTEVAV